MYYRLYHVTFSYLLCSNLSRIEQRRWSGIAFISFTKNLTVKKIPVIH